MAFTEGTRWWIGAAGSVLVICVSTTVWGMNKFDAEENFTRALIEEHRKTAIHEKHPTNDAFKDLKDQVTDLNKAEAENTKLLQKILLKLGDK